MHPNSSISIPICKGRRFQQGNLRPAEEMVTKAGMPDLVAEPVRSHEDDRHDRQLPLIPLPSQE